MAQKYNFQLAHNLERLENYLLPPDEAAFFDFIITRQVYRYGLNPFYATLPEISRILKINRKALERIQKRFVELHYIETYVGSKPTKGGKITYYNMLFQEVLNRLSEIIERGTDLYKNMEKNLCMCVDAQQEASGHVQQDESEVELAETENITEDNNTNQGEYTLKSLLGFDMVYKNQEAMQKAKAFESEVVNIIKNEEPQNVMEEIANKGKSFIWGASSIQKQKDIEHIMAIDKASSFIRYWCEPSQNGNKLRYEMQPTWNTQTRFLNWKTPKTKENVNKQVYANIAYIVWGANQRE